MVSPLELMTEEGVEASNEVIDRNEKQASLLRSQAEDMLKSGQKRDESFHLAANLSKLLYLMIECDQNNLDIDPDGEAILTDKVIRIKKYVNSMYLAMHGIDRTMVGGLYVTAPMYLLPAKKVSKAWSNRWRTVDNPEEYGLPSEKICDYATIKPLDGKCYIALAKFGNSYINEIVKSSRNYEYIFLP